MALICLFSLTRIWLSVFNEILPCCQRFNLLFQTRFLDQVYLVGGFYCPWSMQTAMAQLLVLDLEARL